MNEAEEARMKTSTSKIQPPGTKLGAGESPGLPGGRRNSSATQSVAESVRSAKSSNPISGTGLDSREGHDTGDGIVGGSSAQQETPVHPAPTEEVPLPSTSLHSPLMRTLVSSDAGSSHVSPPQRPALFDDHVASAYVPGSLHLAPDSIVEKLIQRRGAIHLIRQLAGDLAHRDRELVTFRLRAEERERTLKKMLVEVEVSNADIERRLAGCLTKQTSTDGPDRNGDGASFTESINDMMQQALDEEDTFSMVDTASVSNYGDEYEDYSDLITPKATIRVHGRGVISDADSIESGSSQKSYVSRGWKDYFWGQKAGSLESVTTVDQKSTRDGRASGGTSGSNRRKTLQNDFFMPPAPSKAEVAAIPQSASRTSVASGPLT